MKRFVYFFLIFITTAQIAVAQGPGNTKFYTGTVLSVENKEHLQDIKIKITDGNLKGKEVIAQSTAREFKTGDAVILSYEKLPDGKDSFLIVDIVRQRGLLLLFFLFVVFVFVVGRWQGISSLIGMIFSFLIIVKMIVPGILAGNDPIVISLLGGLLIIPVTFLLSHGLSKKTVIAMAGTFFSLLLTGVLAYLFVNITRLTGFAAEEAFFIKDINIKSLLLAGIIVGAMGILDDITISQASVVEKLYESNPKQTFRELYGKAMAVGRDHIASLVNTLMLVYAGASLPLFLLFFNTTMTYNMVINQEIIATEIVRTLVSSIGIIAAVPLTTFLAAKFVKK